MIYVGSKNRLSKQITPIIQKYIDKLGDSCKGYWEPFVGGANMIDKIKCDNKYGSDTHKYLIALLQHIQLTVNDIPNTISKEEYTSVRNNPDFYPDWYVGLVGFCASYKGKWFGGYANRVKTKMGRIRNYTDEAITNLIKQAPALKNIHFECKDFRNIDNIHDYVIYCDPPYHDTTKYATEDFPYDEFYDWCKHMSKIGNIVLISEYYMPDGFQCIWQGTLKCALDKASRSDRIEKLFICCE